MKTFPAGLDTLLATGSYVFCDLYDFTLTDTSATHLRYTTLDVDALYSGNTYTSKGPYFESIQSKARAHWKAGLDVDTWQVQIQPTTADPITGATYPATIFGQPWLTAVRAGAIAGATVDIHRLYMAAWPVPWTTPINAASGYVLVDLFAGRVADIDVSRSAAIVSINSHIEQFLRPMPRHLFQAPCRHNLFDAGCGLTRSSFAIAGTVTTRTNDGNFNTNLGQVVDYFTLGMITWLTGNNLGFSRGVRQHSGPPNGTLQLIAPMPYLIQVGDTFNAYPGDDKSLSTCVNKFNNGANFGGTGTFTPVPETSI